MGQNLPLQNTSNPQQSNYFEKAVQQALYDRKQSVQVQNLKRALQEKTSEIVNRHNNDCFREDNRKNIGGEIFK